MSDEQEVPLPEALRVSPVFADLPDETLAWVAERGEEFRADEGDTLFHAGDEPRYLYVLLAGEVTARPEIPGADTRIYILYPGEIGGILPFSRMRTNSLTGRASEPVRGFRLDRRHFPALLVEQPELAQRLVSLMADRIREVSRIDQQQDKLVALGRLSAGLAHELNNPAAAIRRSSGLLRETLAKLADATLDGEVLTGDRCAFIAGLERELLAAEGRASEVDALARGDLEDEIAVWLEARGSDDAWDLAPALAEAGVDAAMLARVAEALGDELGGTIVRRAALQLLASRLTHEIDVASRRISDLIGAIKQYSYMDQAAEQDVELHAGIENTLLIMNHKLKDKRIRVEREYDGRVPRVRAFGAELNQVWTNLIDNAIDAMEPGGRLGIRTGFDGPLVFVEISDDGHGIPEEQQSRIFDPFYTTKGIGAGTGLGLDTVARIVHKHRGTILVESDPGCTIFRVSLPAV